MLSAKRHIGRTVIISMGMLPAVPISASNFPPLTRLGVNHNSREFKTAPLTSASQSLAAVKNSLQVLWTQPGLGSVLPNIENVKGLAEYGG